MKNVTISMDEQTLAWVRVEAAKAGQSVSRWIGARLRKDGDQNRRKAKAATDLEAFFKHPGWDLGGGPHNREDIYAHLLRGHDDADLSDGSSSSGQEGRVAGVAEDADGK